MAIEKKENDSVFYGKSHSISYSVEEFKYHLFGKKVCPKCGGKMESERIKEFIGEGTIEFNDTYSQANMYQHIQCYRCQDCNTLYQISELAGENEDSCEKPEIPGINEKELFMMHYRLEKVLRYLYWFAVILISREFYFTVSEVVVTAFVILALSIDPISRFYKRPLLSEIKNRVNYYQMTNDFEKCQNFIAKCLKCYPHDEWLQYKATMLWFMAGSFSQYESKYNGLPANVLSNNNRLVMTRQISNIIAYFTMNEIKEIERSDNTFIGIANSIIQDANLGKVTEETTADAMRILENSPHNIDKTFAALFLAKEVYHKTDSLKYNALIEIAKGYAPSQEVSDYIDNHIAAVDNVEK